KVHQAAVDAARCSGFLQGGEADVVVDDDGSPELLAEDFADPCPDQVEGLGRPIDPVEAVPAGRVRRGEPDPGPGQRTQLAVTVGQCAHEIDATANAGF